MIGSRVVRFGHLRINTVQNSVLEIASRTVFLRLEAAKEAFGTESESQDCVFKQGVRLEKTIHHDLSFLRLERRI
jgi:hypothetical protein